YPKETIGYYFYYPPENKVLVAQNAKFLENSLITQEASGSLEDLEIIQEEDTHPSIDTSLNHEEDNQKIDEPQSDINPIRRSTRTRRPTDRTCLYIDAEEHELGDLGEPANYKAALLDPESDKWLNAMNVEMQSMKDNEGYTQTPWIDYEEIFSPIADIRAIRILIAIAAYYDYEILKMDVKNAFLNGYLSEEVYMEQPESFVNPKYPNRVCKLKCSIYGLKQASRQWNKRFDDEIKKFGFTQNRDEPCVYLKASGSNITFLILYVDDILIMGNHIPMLQDVKSYPGRCFAMKDLGEAAYILEIKIYRDRLRRLRFVLDCVLSWNAFCQALRFAHLKTNCCVLLRTNSKLRSKDRPPMLAPGRYPQWRSRFLRYVDTRPNDEALRKCILSGPYKPTIVLVNAVKATNDSPSFLEHTTVETPTNIDDIYSTIDACQTAHEMWKAIERLQQGESLNIQDVKTNLFWEFGKFTSHDGESMESYYTRFYKLMNEMIRNNLTVTTMQVNVQFLQQLQPEWSRFVTIVKQQHKLDEVAYHKLFDILKQYQNEVNELRTEKLARNANPLALVATAQASQYPFYQTPRSHKSSAPSLICV
nr:hypothetical protein [Tanacetum cinerariifolium]